MYGLIEVHTDTIKRAYTVLKKQCKDIEETGNLNLENDEDCVFTIEQRKHLKGILEDILYASYISSNDLLLIKLEIAGLIQDVLSIEANLEEMEITHV